VFEGTFSGRTVAVKRISKSEVKPCRTEIELLIKLDVQKNIVRYFIEEVDESFFYIALEKCDFTLKDYVQRSDLIELISKKRVVQEIFEGFKWLHSKKIGEKRHQMVNEMRSKNLFQSIAT
jgi:serine/threonine-protein kinase/endoribonuclease IRE1